MSENFTYNDGGRSQYFKGKNAGDCAVRAMAIAMGLDYKDCYNEIAKANAKAGYKKSARDGVFKAVFENVLKEHGWYWCSAPRFEGRKARHSDMPMGNVIASMARHYTAIVDKEIHDTFDCSHKMVYGYYAKR